MAKVKCNVARMTTTDLYVFGLYLVGSMTDNPVYAELQHLLPPLEEASEDLRIAAVDAANNGGRRDHIHQRSCVAKVCELINDLVPRVQTASGGDEANITSAGFEVRKGRGPSQTPETPHSVHTLLTPLTGVMLLRWKGHRHAHYYHVEMQRNNGEWVVVATSTRCGVTITGVDSGKHYTLRIISFGTGGRSAMSKIMLLRAA